MEVLLKKSKITNSILKQTVRSSLNDFKNFEILGWCVYDGTQYIVLYNQSTFQIKKHLVIKEFIVKKKNNENEKDMIELKFGGNYVSHHYKFDNEEETKEAIELLKKVITKVDDLGQFYI